VSKHERRPLNLLNNVRDREGFAGSGRSQQCLMNVAFLDSLQEFFNSHRLVAGRLKGGNELERLLKHARYCTREGDMIQWSAMNSPSEFEIPDDSWPPPFVNPETMPDAWGMAFSRTKELLMETRAQWKSSLRRCGIGHFEMDIIATNDPLQPLYIRHGIRLMNRRNKLLKLTAQESNQLLNQMPPDVAIQIGRSLVWCFIDDILKRGDSPQSRPSDYDIPELVGWTDSPFDVNEEELDEDMPEDAPDDPRNVVICERYPELRNLYERIIHRRLHEMTWEDLLS